MTGANDNRERPGFTPPHPGPLLPGGEGILRGETCYAPPVVKNGKKSKTRADVALVERGLAESRSRAQAVILAGLVFSGERRVEKAGDSIAEDAPLEVRGQDHPWVSRGGLKLDHALEELGIDVTGTVAIDVGASTGGFTDVLLTRGAARSMRSMWATASLRGSCARMTG